MTTPTQKQQLDAYWLPYTANRQFKAEPRIITSAQGCYLTDTDGRKVFDGLSGLWTCGLGHQQAKIVEAVKQQLQTLDFAPSFQFAHPSALLLIY
ncbi:MAG: aminotransferase class III-fold pyridoxal phosphate-dependent enzyme [Shewanella sp.]|nr:aminotransferase class III-fold pyridoxal phosphate-dependent enzyme [Shewanella sp.]